MSTRYYPLYQRGNPQLRIFLPNFWMKLIRPAEPLPKNMVLFQTSIEMTHYDVKNYLEKIYKVPVVEVRTTIKMGEIKKSGNFRDKKLFWKKDDDYKEALVTLQPGTEFEFPNVVFDESEKKLKKLQDLDKNENWGYKRSMKVNKLGVPDWFL